MTVGDVRRAIRSRDTVLAVVVLGAIAAYPGTLFSASGLARTAFVMTVAIGLLVVVVTGGIDFSVGPVAALALVMPVGLALLIGLASGLVNGILVARTRIPPYLVTLATSALLVGASAQARVADGPWWPGACFAAAVVVIAHLMFTRTRTGLHMYFVGSNEDGAWFSGIRPGVVRISVYVTAGLLAALAGTLAGTDTGNLGAGIRLDLLVLTAVLIGGASLSGGRGTVLGTVCGTVLCMQMLAALDALRISQYGQQCVQIAVLLLVAAINARRQARVRPT
jgi:ribose/xylose/arabinose/galactoside ABC-type transport system permease subunit